MATIDVYQRAVNDFAGSFAADATALTFSTGDATLATGMVTQSLGVNYAQALSQLYELGTTNTYFIVGRAQGQMQLSRIIGPAQLTLAFYTKFGNACNANNNNIVFKLKVACSAASTPSSSGTGAAGGNKLSVRIKHAVIVNLGLNTEAQSMIINEGSALRFVSMEYSLSDLTA